LRPALAYRHRPGPLGDGSALAASLFCAAPAGAALVSSDPIVLAGALAAVVTAGLLAGARRGLALAARWNLGLGVILIAVNGLTSQRGDTVLVHGIVMPLIGNVDISAEALGEGAVLAARIGIICMAFAVHATTVDPDRVLRLLRPIARRSALTATLIARTVPLAARDYARLGEASALRGPLAAPAGRAVLARRLVAGSLDRAVDVAATLELRGYGHGAPGRADRLRRSRHDTALVGSALALFLASAGTRLAGLADFRAYPALRFDAGAWTIAAALAMPLAAAAPFALAALRSRIVGGRSGA
jgi:energy-coupling factor transport system permease protein